MCYNHPFPFGQIWMIFLQCTDVDKRAQDRLESSEILAAVKNSFETDPTTHTRYKEFNLFQ